MRVNSETPKESFVIGGISFSIAAPYNEGDTITEGEADSLNQTLRENVRNNLASEIAEEQEKAKAEGREVNMSALQARVDGYVKDYEFGVRKGGGGRISDPVEAKAMELAREKVRERIKARPDLKLATFSAKDISGYAKQLLDKNPGLREQAKMLVEQERQVANSILDDVSISAPVAGNGQAASAEQPTA